MTENSLNKLDFYKNGKIYRIVCNETGLQYIGSTCKTLKQRLQQHKSSYKSYKDGKGTNTTSYKILENDNYAIVLIEDFSCDRKEQLNARERFYIESMTCVNKNSPNKMNELGKDEYNKQYCKQYRNDNKEYFTQQAEKYYNDNLDKISDYKKEYYDNNRYKILEKQNQKILCIHCGCNYTKVNKLRHEKSKKRQKNISDDDNSAISDQTISLEL